MLFIIKTMANVLGFKFKYLKVNLLLLVTAINASAQPILYTQGRIFYLSPGVKKLVTNVFAVSNNQIEKSSSTVYMAEFDSSGKCSKEIFPSGKAFGYKYDKKGNLIEESVTNHGQLDGYARYDIDYEKKVVIRQEKRFNDSMIYTLSQYDTASKILRTYEMGQWQSAAKFETVNNGNVIVNTEFGCKDSTCKEYVGVQTKTEELDTNGNCVKITYFRKDNRGDSSVTVEEYLYNGLGKKIKMASKSVAIDYLKEVTEQYDHFGNMVERMVSYGGKLSEHFFFQYQYDNRGNRIHYKKLDANHNLLAYSETSYVYY